MEGEGDEVWKRVREKCGLGKVEGEGKEGGR